MLCYISDEGALNLVDAVEKSDTLAALSALVILLLIVAGLSSWSALRAAREMRRLRAETDSYPQYYGGPTTGPNSSDANSGNSYPRWEN
ncbi:hypothetical protein OG746_03755 [Streptomyces sp. NBC_01016]|uniref:hypothetical protein n=1 Tax=unclassified Streptomyces TaxID=2593676 RepID=UPI0022568DEB|nr:MULTISPECIES: hypothetical protein [unclassified Streptomyces]MCX4827852.1 hypothetical protein [Streptomyces sp. NBC_01016]